MCGAGCALILSFASGCASGSGGNFCAIYEPIYTSPEDTAETQRQVDRNNAVYLEMCE